MKITNISHGPKVKLVNPEILKTYLSDVGRFASVCYSPNRESTEASMSKWRAIGKNCIKNGHWSPARHQYLIFEIDGGSRSFTHQLVRHSVGVEVNQRSQRYVDETIPAVYVPASIGRNIEALDVYLSHMEQVWGTIAKLKAMGIPQEDYREILPNATPSDINIAVSVQALKHLCEERLCTRASYQIRSAVMQMRDIVVSLEPELASILVCKCDALGFCPEEKGCGKYDKNTLC